MISPSAPTDAEILALWDTLESVEPDISTERLSRMVCDHFGGAIDDADVAHALLRRHKANGGEVFTP
jgi:hypothetical protein